MEKHQRITEYPERYLGDYGFESVMVSARQRLVLEVLGKINPRVVLEAGCGVDMLGERVSRAGLPVEQWVIVEPSEQFCDAARALTMGATRVDVIRGFLEESTDAIRQRCIRLPDVIVCSGLLNEVEDPVAVLRAAARLMPASGMVHVNVPNAYSLHRRLAMAMGIIRTEKQLTGRNQRLAQYRVFDMDSLIDVVKEAGLRVREQGGYFIKPFTHDQMKAIDGILSEEILDGLWKLGRDMPELASEIYVNAAAA